MPRKYESKLREQRAAATRARVQNAARRLLAGGGFSGSTIKQIAAEAGVSAQTIYAVFGSKAEVVASVLRDIEQQAGEAETVARITAETQPAVQLHIFASWIRRLYEEGEDLFAASLEAPSEPAFRVLRADGKLRRLEGCRWLCNGWSAAGILRGDQQSDAVAKQIWLLTGVETYLDCVRDLDWTPDQYENWLAAVLHRVIFAG